MSITQLKIEVYNNPHIYEPHLQTSTGTDTVFQTEFVDLLWTTISNKYSHSGQYADNELMMAMVTALQIDIQLHGESDVLLNVEGRIPSHTIHLLYCGIPTNGNRGNHYDALIRNLNIQPPIQQQSVEYNNYTLFTPLPFMPPISSTHSTQRCTGRLRQPPFHLREQFSINTIDTNNGRRNLIYSLFILIVHQIKDKELNFIYQIIILVSVITTKSFILYSKMDQFGILQI
jgi:hypothetical protein